MCCFQIQKINDLNYLIKNILKLKSIIESLHTKKYNAAVLKKYNNPNIEQLGICSVKLRHKDKLSDVDSLYYKVMVQHYCGCQT